MLPRERAKALGWLSAATSAGVIIGPAIGSFMHRFGEAAPGLFASALVLVNVAFAWKWLPESRWSQAGVTRTGREGPRPSVTLGDAVRNIVQPAVRVVADPTRPISLLIWIYALALLFPANSALVSHRAHHDEIGLTLGVQQTYRGLAAIVGPVYAGGAYQSLGQHIPFFISAAIIVVVAYLTLRIPEQDRPPQVAVST